MVTLKIDCVDPNDYEKVMEAAEKAAGSCNITYAKQHEEMVKAGNSKSRKESSRKIAEETGETPGAVEQRIIRGEKELHPVADKEKKTNSNTSKKVKKKPKKKTPKETPEQVSPESADKVENENKPLHSVAENETPTKTTTSGETYLTELIEEKIQNGMSVYEAAKAVIEYQTGKTEADVKNNFKDKTNNFFDSLSQQDVAALEALEKATDGEIDEQTFIKNTSHKVNEEIQKEYENLKEYEEFEENRSYNEFVGSFRSIADRATGSKFQEPLLMKARILRTTLDYYIKKWE